MRLSRKSPSLPALVLFQTVAAEFFSLGLSFCESFPLPFGDLLFLEQRAMASVRLDGGSFVPREA